MQGPGCVLQRCIVKRMYSNASGNDDDHNNSSRRARYEIASNAQAIESECDGKTKPNVTTNIHSKKQILNRWHWDSSDRRKDDSIERRTSRSLPVRYNEEV